MLAAMAGMIPQSFINNLVDRMDIVDVVGPRVQLRKAGGHHIGLCPFHDEKTPSFHVYPDGHYHCFGCSAHGTTLGFLMEMDGLAFVEAVESLAAMAGLEVPRERGQGRRVDAEVYDVLAAADRCYRRWLRQHAEGAAAIDYLKSRGLRGETVRDFGIGLAPSGWDGLKVALASFGESKLLAAGLLTQNDQGRTYDRFRQRIVFPIRDTRGRVIGFGGRLYDGSGAKGEGPREGEPKYLNSPETAVFKKGHELYGLFEARHERRLDSVVLVEGYMDVVALAEQGVPNAVAALGTAIGEAHFNRLYRHVNRVTCCFDGDEAGIRAASRAIDAAFPALSEQRELRFVFLPEGEDPDTVVRSQGRAHFEGLIDAAKPAGEYFLESLQTGLDLAVSDNRALLVDLALPHVNRLPNGALRTVLVGDLARLSRTPVEKLEARLNGAEAAESRPTSTTAPPAAIKPPRSKLDLRLLEHLVKHPSLVHALASADRRRLIEAEPHGLLAHVVSYLADEHDADTATLLGRFVGETAYEELAGLAERPALLSEAHVRTEFVDGVRQYLEGCERNARLALLTNLRESGSVDDLREFWQRRA